MTWLFTPPISGVQNPTRRTPYSGHFLVVKLPNRSRSAGGAQSDCTTLQTLRRCEILGKSTSHRKERRRHERSKRPQGCSGRFAVRGRRAPGFSRRPRGIPVSSARSHRRVLRDGDARHGQDAASNDQKPGGAVATYIGERRAAAHPRFTATRSYAPQVRMSVTPGCFSDSTRTCTVFPQAVE